MFFAPPTLCFGVAACTHACARRNRTEPQAVSRFRARLCFLVNQRRVPGVGAKKKEKSPIHPARRGLFFFFASLSRSRADLLRPSRPRGSCGKERTTAQRTTRSCTVTAKRGAPLRHVRTSPCAIRVTPSKCNAKKKNGKGAKEKKRRRRLPARCDAGCGHIFLCLLFFIWIRLVSIGGFSTDETTQLVFHPVLFFDFCHRERRDNTRQAARPQDHKEKKKGNNRTVRRRRHGKRKQKREGRGLVVRNGAGQTLRRGAVGERKKKRPGA